MAFMKKWTIAFLIMATAVLPVATGNGTPTYALFAIMTCSCALPLGYSILEKDSVIFDRMAFITLILIASVGILTTAGVHLPVISNLVRPLLAEKEKTYQMEEVIRWAVSSDYKDYRLVLCQPAGSPSVTTNAVERTSRAPTRQDYLDKYVNSLWKSSYPAGTGQLFVCFGGEKIEGAKSVLTIEGKYSGEAIVWIRNQAADLCPTCESSSTRWGGGCG
jgi:hypothetical protein